MNTNNQQTLVILKPHKIFQFASLLLKIFWIGIILRSIQLLLGASSVSLPISFILFVILFFSLIFWVILNTIDTSVVITTDGIFQRGVLWKTYIAWDSVQKIELSIASKTVAFQKQKSRQAEIYAKPNNNSFNNKISFDTSLHRNARIGVYYVLQLAEQYNIQVKTSWWSPSYGEWKIWAKRDLDS